MEAELIKVSKVNLGYDPERIRKSLSSIVESLPVLQIEQLKQIAKIDYSKAFSFAYASLDSMSNIIKMA